MINAVDIIKDGKQKRWICGDCASKIHLKYNPSAREKFKKYAMPNKFVRHRRQVIDPQDIREVFSPPEDQLL